MSADHDSNRDVNQQHQQILHSSHMHKHTSSATFPEKNFSIDILISLAHLRKKENDLDGNRLRFGVGDRRDGKTEGRERRR